MGGNRHYTLRDKHCIQVKLSTYLKRRDENKLRKAKVEYLTKRIYSFRRSLKRLKIEEEEVKVLASKVEDFTGIRIWKNSGRSVDKKTHVARGIFCKYGIDNGIKGANIAWYLNYNNSETAYIRRTDFQKSFDKNTDNLRRYKNFKTYIQNDII